MKYRSADDVSSNFMAVTPNDDADQPEASGVYCLTTGNLVAQNANGTSVTFPMTAGQELRISPKRVMETSTGTYALLR